MSIEITVDSVQPFEHASLVVSGLTTVMGQNNAGKTSITRAIKACVANGSGTSLVRNGCDAATVTITSGDQTLLWSKSHKGKSSYRINGEDPIFPGRELPDEVKDFGIRPLYLTGETVWPQISSQFNELYLIDKPGSLLGEAISDVNKVSRLNGALKLSEAAWRTATAEVTQCQKELDSVGAKLDKLVGLHQLVAEREQFDLDHQLLLKDEDDAEQLAKTLAQRTKLIAQLDALSSVASLKLAETDLAKQAEGLLKIRAVAQKRLARTRELDALEAIPAEVKAVGIPTQPLVELVALRARRALLQRSIVDVPTQLASVEIDVSLLQTLVDTAAKKAKATAALDEVVNAKVKTEQSLLAMEPVLAVRLKELHDAEHQVNQDKGICSQCNRPL